MDFRSDNVAAAHPAIVEAVLTANEGSADAYGEDAFTRRLERHLRDLFEHEVAVCLVSTGTAANALSLSLHAPPWGSIYCHPEAHIQVAEAGAPELFSGGAKLVSVSRGDSLSHGKLDVEGVDETLRLDRTPRAACPSVLSLSQATELGTVYSVAELEALSEVARRHALALHIDGARFANALVALEHSPAELTWKVGVDALAFGATKNGAMGVEAVVSFDGRRAEELRQRQRRAGQQLSKSRFAAAQLTRYLEGELWLQNARRANEAAQRLGAGLAAEGIAPRVAVQTNQVFCDLSADLAARLRARGFLFHDWPHLGSEARRFVTAFNTLDEDVDALLEGVRNLRRVGATS